MLIDACLWSKFEIDAGEFLQYMENLAREFGKARRVNFEGELYVHSSDVLSVECLSWI